MFEDIGKYLKRRKRQKALKKIRRYAGMASIVLLPVVVLVVVHVLKKKAKKKLKAAVKVKIQEGFDKRNDKDEQNFGVKKDECIGSNQ